MLAHPQKKIKHLVSGWEGGTPYTVYIYIEREREKKNANVKLGTGHVTVKPAFDDLGLGFEGVLLRRLDDVYGINITPFFKAIRDQDTRNIQVTFFLVKIIISQINTWEPGLSLCFGA